MRSKNFPFKYFLYHGVNAVNIMHIYFKRCRIVVYITQWCVVGRLQELTSIWYCKFNIDHFNKTTLQTYLQYILKCILVCSKIVCKNIVIHLHFKVAAEALLLHIQNCVAQRAYNGLYSSSSEFTFVVWKRRSNSELPKGVSQTFQHG